ncbi:helix-turn-helix transcriptional regulator [Eggerthellaceae bacterium 24-137]
MKLPYIKVEVEYREEETGAPGKVSPALIVGFGLHWAWVYLFMFNGQYVLFPEADSMQLLLSATSGAVHAVALLLYAICLKKARELFDTPQHIRRNRVVAACLVAAATVLCMAGNFVSVGPLAALCFVAAGVTSGVGSAMLLMSFGVSFSVCDLPTIALCTALSLVVSALAFALTLLVSSVLVPAGALLCLALPFLELLCLNKCSADLVDKLEFAFLTMPVRTASFAGRIGVPSVVFGVLLGILRCCALTGPLLDLFLAEGAAANAFSSSVFTASVFTCLALIMAMLTLRRSRNFAFRVLVPVIAALLALLCSPCGDDGFFRCFALFSSYFMLEASLWVMYSDIAQSYRVSAFTTYGFGHGLLSAGSLAGFLMLQPGGLLEGVSVDSVALALVGLIALTLGVATLPNATEMRSTLIRGRLCPLFDDRTDLEELVGGGSTSFAADAGADGAVAGGAGSPATQIEASSLPERPDTAASASPVEAPASAPSAADAASDSAQLASSQDAVPESPEQRAGRFKRKCAAVADTFLLSRKETEVLFLLAKGRNSAAIQEALYISAGTANTHMRHIYRKLDVHSQHELINLVESMEVE